MLSPKLRTYFFNIKFPILDLILLVIKTKLILANNKNEYYFNNL